MFEGFKAWLNKHKKEREVRKLAKKTSKRYKSRVIGVIRPAKPSSVKPNKPNKVSTVSSVVNAAVTQPHIREGSKKAVLIGLNYTGTTAALKGCINDATRMKETLEKKYLYQNVTIFTDQNLSEDNNILEILEKLVTSDEKTLFFQYSGHGMQIQDNNGDEADGKDEALYSVCDTIVRDDDINERIRKVKKDVTMIIVVDACHSGTVVDLPYQLVGNEVKKVNNTEIVGDIVYISGCKDTQTSADISSAFTAYGAMSNALQKVITELSPSTTWRVLIDKLNKELRKERQSQIPQLCVSKPELVDRIVSL